ncbi:GNAT family N-acetyltransferase [Halobacteriales archaeon SW_10_68_16]|jgi:ribosomal protein S18 acetylase RimI-like enzyme|nr:MAG: GNAT family N-acetyltransferase [Halobacteriales archaeon SW_10_68_16]
MDIRAARPEDRDAVREITKRSLETSYSLSPATIEGAVEEWYGEDAFEEKVESDDTVFLVSEVDEVVGFSEGVLVAEGGQADILWLHVHPDHRGQGIGEELYEHLAGRLEEMGAEYLRGRVLADNQMGATFYEDRGFEQVDEERIEIDDDRHVEYIYSNAVSRQLRSLVTDDGRVVYVDRTDEEVGSDAPFNVVLEDPEGETHYGYFCTNCDELANAMSANGRIKCAECGNTRKPTRWDASYL